MRWYVLLLATTGVLWVGLAIPSVASAITAVDVAMLRAIARLRTDVLTSLFQGVDDALSAVFVQVVAGGTIVVLLAFRRYQHLLTYLTVVLVASVLDSSLLVALGRMRPAGMAILTDWDGYSHPSVPVTRVALVLTTALLTLVPRGRWRRSATTAVTGAVALLCIARLYLAVDHPTDVFAALAVGCALPVVVFRLVVPEEVFPVSYTRGQRAHLDVGGRRGEAIVAALDQQLGLDVVSLEPFGLGGSAGSTPLRLRSRAKDTSNEAVVFAKLYARSHLRSDRWYKLVRTIFYGRLEDEKPFSSVRRLVEYEDHLLRLCRDAGLPTPRPYGFAEITPEREYVIVMEFFDGARELGDGPVGDAAIDDALAIVRRLWDAGIAHRDIKPSNLLTRDDRVFLIDVAFATVRPTPWRQAVDLANMMLTLAVSSSPELVYQRALGLFAPDDIAEAFAASHSVTIPTQLRAGLRADGRDILGTFCRLAPERRPIPVQLWSVKRVAITLAVVGALGLAGILLVVYLNVAVLI